MTSQGKPCQYSKRVRRRQPLKLSFVLASITIQLLLSFCCIEQEVYAYTNISAKRKLVDNSSIFSHDEREVSTEVFLDRNNDFKHRKMEWIDRSIKYYTTLRRTNDSNGIAHKSQEHPSNGEILIIREAVLMHAALRKIKERKFQHAEIIYRRSIEKSIQDIRLMDDGHCDYAKLAVPTLLLALLKQRVGDTRGARSVFLNFLNTLITTVEDTTVFKCRCSAKVLQAFGLFEMKCGNARKSLYLLEKAISMDETLTSVLSWTQFRDAEIMKKGISK